MKNHFTYIWLFILMACPAVQAEITPYSSNFSSASETNNWVSVGAMATGIGRFAVSANDFNDGDATQALPYSDGMLITGDGIRGDGGMFIDLKNATAKDEAIGYTLSGTIELDETITFNFGLYNQANTVFFVIAQIWNVTDGRVLATTETIRIAAGNAADYQPLDSFLQYTATADDVGDTIQIRFMEDSTSTARDVFIDNVSISSELPKRIRLIIMH